jgi:hypothetical protein
MPGSPKAFYFSMGILFYKKISPNSGGKIHWVICLPIAPK